MSPTESTGSNVSGMFASFGAVAANYMQDKMLKKMDADGSGLVEQSEFKDALDKLGLKLGMDGTADADAMFASLDADGSGSLTGSEVGQIIKNVFSGQANTNAFVQSRGDEQRFAELDVDGDGTISMAEFGIGSGGEGVATAPGAGTMGVGDPVTGAMPITGQEAAVAAANGKMAVSGQKIAAASDTGATAPLNEDAVKALMASVDNDGNGKISGQEINAFVAQLSGQMETASKKYNDTALASFSTNKLNAAA